MGCNKNLKDKEKRTDEKSGIPKHFKCSAALGKALKKPIPKN